MNTCKWTLLLLASLSFQVSAAAIADGQLKLKEVLAKNHFPANVHIVQGSSKASPMPVRHASMRVRVTKTVITKDPSGGYNSVDFDVCTKSTTIDVYDVRNGGSPIDLPDGEDRVRCTSTYNGQPIEVKLGGNVALFRANIFGADEDIKMVVPNLKYDVPVNTGGTPVVATLSAYSAAASADVNNKSLLLDVGVQNQISCTDDSNGHSDCNATFAESFSAVVDVQD